jgi:NAD-dependent dihydropyrimidine dehydrogenase PreA subunit
MAKRLSSIEKTRRAARDPKRPGEKCNAAPGAFHPVIDHSRCEGKADCVEVCPHAVFDVRSITAGDFQRLSVIGKLKSMAHGRMTAYAVAPERCRACGLCVVACPERAIEFERPSLAPAG